MIDNYTNVFQNNKNLKTIIMHNSNYQSINKIIDSLYDNGNLGELSITGVDDLLNVNTNIATNKNWNVI